MVQEKKLKVYMGRAGTGKTTACFVRIRELLQREGNSKIILLAPEPITYKLERELVEFMPEKGFHSVQVLGLNRLAHQVFQAVGVQRETTLTDTGRNLIIRSILKKRDKELTIFQKAAKQANFANILKEMMKECQAFGITPSMLQEGAHLVSSSLLKKKLEDLSLIASDYNTILEDRFTEVPDTLAHLQELLPTVELVQDAYIFIDGFHWFTPQQQQIINTLIFQAKEAVLTLTLPPDTYHTYSRRGTLFHRTWETYEELQKVHGEAIEVRPFTNNYRRIGPLEKGFFSTPTVIQQESLQIPLYVATNRACEVDFICRSIRKAVQEEGRRWKDFAIMLRDSEGYGDAFEKGMKRYEIPYFSDYRHPMMSHPLAELLEGIFAVCESGYGHDPLFRVLKTDLFPLSRQSVDELENYCLEFAVYEGRWQEDEPWIWQRPSFVREGQVDTEALRLSRINESRMIVQSIFKPFMAFAKERHRGQEWCESIYNLLETLHIKESLSRWYEEDEKEGHLEEAKGHLQMYKAVIALLEEIHGTCGEEVLGADDIALLLQEGLNEVTYSIVPPTLDHVMITSIERSYATEFPIVYVPGLNDGVFPRRMGDEGVLRDQEREVLRENGIVLAAGALVQAFNENFLFYLACTRAKEKVILSYISSDEDNKPMEASLVVRRLQQTKYCDAPMVIPLDIPVGQEEDYIWRPQQSLSLLSSQFLPLEEGQPVAPIWWSLYHWGLAMYPTLTTRLMRGLYDTNVVPIIDKNIVDTLLLRSGQMTGSVTRLERYNACPFSFYAQYVLRLEKRRVRKFETPEIGVYLHENLCVIGKELLAQNKQWHDISEEEMSQLIRKVADEVAENIAYGMLEESAYNRNMKEQLIKTLEKTIARLRVWSAHSSFKMLALEQDFGRHKEGWKALHLQTKQGVDLRLQGQIDRIDLWEHENQTYGLIIDYKSGSTNIKAQDVYYGLRVQLLTYLLALEQAKINNEIRDTAGNPIGVSSGISNMPYLPAGLIYTYVKNPTESRNMPLTEEEVIEDATTKPMKNGGYFSDNRDVLIGIDSTIETSKSPFVPITFKKDGTLAKYSVSKTKSIADFKNLMTYTEAILSHTGSQIVDGVFPIAPYRLGNSSGCHYCEYSTVCRFDVTQGDCAYRLLEPLKEADALVRIEDALQESSKSNIQKGNEQGGKSQ